MGNNVTNDTQGNCNKCDLIRVFNHELLKSEDEITFSKKEFEGELYVGDFFSSKRKEVVKRKFTHVIHVEETGEGDDYKGYPSYIEELEFKNFCDTHSNNLFKILPECFQFTDRAFTKNEKSKILIHCAAGISRSSSVCAAIIMRKKKMSFDDVCKAMKIDRDCVQPNRGFMNQLLFFEWNNYVVDEKLLKMSVFLVDPQSEYYIRSQKMTKKDFIEIEKKSITQLE